MYICDDTMFFMWRQGDVLIIPVNELPKDAEVVQDGGDIILAHGEKTGHHHRIKSDNTKLLRSPSAEKMIEAAQHILRAPQERGQPTQTRGFLHLPEAAKLTHEEHAAIELPAGNFRVIIQREYVAAEKPIATLQPALSSPSRSSRRPEDTAWTWNGSWRSVED